MVSRVLPVLLLLALAAAFLSRTENVQSLKETFFTAKSQVADRPEYQLRGLNIVGASDVLAGEIEATLGFEFPVSTLAIDPDALRDTITSLKAVAQAEVGFAADRTLTVQVTENAPAAVLQLGDGQLVYVASDGARLRDRDDRSLPQSLPLIAGDGAQNVVFQALQLYSELEPINHKLRGFVWVGQRRWDVVFDSGLVLSLPEGAPMPAIYKFILLSQSLPVLDGQIVRVDFRNNERPTLRLREGDTLLRSASGLAVWGLDG